MFISHNISLQIKQRSRFFSLLTMAALLFPSASALSLYAANVQQNSPQPQSRRPLPKPPKGARGFEQYAGRDASTRLIGMGATRGPRIPRTPVAPLEGITLDTRPFFLWEPAPQSASYKFTLYDGDVYADKSAPIVYETETTQPQLIYPQSAPALVKGKLYSWRISAPSATIRDGSSGSITAGAPVRLFVLMDEDAAPIKQAMADAGISASSTSADRFKQAQILADYGVWYDALRIARELSAEHPKDEAIAKFYSSLIENLDQ
jgi:hypothetical protein